MAPFLADYSWRRIERVSFDKIQGPKFQFRKLSLRGNRSNLAFFGEIATVDATSQ